MSGSILISCSCNVANSTLGIIALWISRFRMLLDCLPNEILRVVFRSLTPAENFLLRQTSRRFRFLIVASYMLTLDPNCVQVDFGNQVLILYQLNTIKRIAVVNGNIEANEYQEDHARRSNYLNGEEFQVFCDVGHNWSKSMQKYLKKLNKQFVHSILCILGVILPLDGSIPDELLQLTISFNNIIIQTSFSYFCPWMCQPLPEVLDKWLSKGNVKHSLSVYYTFSISQIDRLLNTPKVKCLLEDEGALYILNKYLDQNLPHTQTWYLYVEPNAIGFLEALKDHFGLSREDLGEVFIEPSFVHINGSHQLQIALHSVTGSIQMYLKKV